MSEGGEIIRGHLVPREPDREPPGVMQRLMSKLLESISDLDPKKLGWTFLRGKAYEPAAKAQKIMVEAMEIAQRTEREDRLAEADIEIKRAEARAKNAEATRTAAEAQKAAAEAAQTRVTAFRDAMAAVEKARGLGIELSMEMIQTLIGQPTPALLPAIDSTKPSASAEGSCG